MARKTAADRQIGASPYRLFRAIARTGLTNADDSPENHLLP